MAKRDEETGIEAKAIDGEPDAEQTAADSELEQRRQLREARERVEEEQVAGKRGSAIDDQPEDDSEAEMFPRGAIPGDHKKTLKNMVPGAKSRKVEAKLRATPIDMRDGLVDYGDLVELLVTVEAGKVEELPDLAAPESGGRRLLMGVKDVQHFRPVHVRSAADVFTLEQVLDILEEKFGIPRSADKVAEVFGPVTAEQRAAAAAG